MAKDVLKEVSPIILGGFRGLIGGALILGVYLKKINWHEQRQFLLGFLGVAFFGFFINQILFLNGLKNTSALNTAIILNTIPVTTVLMAMIFKIEIFSKRKLFGALLGFSMVSILATFNKGSGLGNAQMGDLLIFISVVCLCIATNISKVVIKKGAFPALVSGNMLFFGGLGLCLLGIKDFPQIWEYSLSGGTEAFKMFYEVVFSTALTYFLSMEALKYLSPSQNMIFIYAQPLMTSSIDILFFGRWPHWIIIPVFLGVVLSGWLVISEGKKKALKEGQ